MSVIRTRKTKNYTVVDNRYLKNTTLSLRSKGLFTQILSLPDDWEYSISGLACINRDGEDSIRAGIKELEQAGYIIRLPKRDSLGKFQGYEYIIHEHPLPVPPSPGCPALDIPTSECPALENGAQLNTDKLNKDLLNPHPSNIQSDLSEDRGGWK